MNRSIFLWLLFVLTGCTPVFTVTTPIPVVVAQSDDAACRCVRVTGIHVVHAWLAAGAPRVAQDRYAYASRVPWLSATE